MSVEVRCSDAECQATLERYVQAWEAGQGDTDSQQKWLVVDEESLTDADVTAYDAMLWLVAPESAKNAMAEAPVLQRPFRLRALGEALYALQLGASSQTESARLRLVDNAWLDVPKREMVMHTETSKAPHVIALTEKETHLLRAVAEAGEAGISRDNLLQQVWGYAANLDTHTLETHLYRLRGKLAQMGGICAISTHGGQYYLTSEAAEG